jgi:hyaluronoglucosaminidase
MNPGLRRITLRWLSAIPAATALAAIAFGTPAALGAVTRSARAASPAPLARSTRCRRGPGTAYVGATGKVGGQQTLTAVSLATGKVAGRRIKAGPTRGPITITPHGSIAYVANRYSDTVTPVSTCTGRALTAIRTGAGPTAAAITPDGRLLYVASYSSGSVTPIKVATGAALKPIKVGPNPWVIAITPNGKTAYVTSRVDNTVTPIDTATGRAGKPIKVGPYPRFVLITPNGKLAFVSSHLTASYVTPIVIATGAALPMIKIRGSAEHFAMAPDGRTAYVVSLRPGTLTPISTVTARGERPVPLQGAPPTSLSPRKGGVLFGVAGEARRGEAKRGRPGPGGI